MARGLLPPAVEGTAPPQGRWGHLLPFHMKDRKVPGLRKTASAPKDSTKMVTGAGEAGGAALCLGTYTLTILKHLVEHITC